MDAAAIAAVFAGAVAVLTAFFAFVKWIVTQLVKSLDKNSASMTLVAKATTKSAKEAAQRNGHLAELAIENKKANAEQNKAILQAIGNLPTQHVGKQIVDKQTVNN